MIFKGIAVSEGISIAKVIIVKNPHFDINSSNCENSDEQINLYEQAINKTVEQIQKIKQIAIKKIGNEKAEIFDAHIAIANDQEIKNNIIDFIKTTKVNAAFAVEKIFEKYREMFTSMSDEYFKERAADIKDVKKRILSHLLNIDLPEIINIDKEAIIVANDLSPSDIALLDNKYIKGFITEVGGRTSHAAIMARTMEIPAVLGVNNILEKVNKDDIIGINGIIGEIEINPVNINEWEQKIKSYQNEKDELKDYINKESITKDKHKIHIESNIGKHTDIESALKFGAEGVGLFRTEFLYMDNTQWPTEEEQFQSYKYVLQQAKDKLIVIRTLDIGGDKKLSYFSFPNELNPFLGYRAIRISLDKLEMFETQLRALGRASIYGKLAIMFPMIATVEEFIKAKEFTLSCFEKLKNEGIEIAKNIQIGMMIEIPSSAILANQFAKYADFFSIGTNDLIQYTFACDRMSPNVVYLYQPNNPSLLKLLKNVVDSAHKYKKWVGMCGEMAGDSMSIPILLGLNLDAFSMSPTTIPKARKIVNNLKYRACKRLANACIKKQTQNEVNELVKKFLLKKKLIK